MAWMGHAAEYVRVNMPIFAGIGVTTLITASLLPDTIFLARLRRAVAWYEDGKQVPLDSHTTDLVERVIRRINLRAEEEALVTAFSTSLVKPLHYGSIKLRTGALIGLPGTFAYDNNTMEGITKAGRLVSTLHSIDTESVIGQTLLATFMLTDKGKAFAIARETYYVSSYHVHIDAFFRFFWAFAAYTAGTGLRVTFMMGRVKAWARVIVYALVGSASLVPYLSSWDAYQCWLDNRVDRHASRLSRAYAEGGVEFYNKELERNRTLHSLGGIYAARYTKFGNEVVSSWRQPSAPVTARRDKLKQYLDEWNAELAEANAVPAET